MNGREAQAYKRLQDENMELRKQLELFQSEKKEERTIEFPPPTKEKFNKMGYQERVTFKRQFPELYTKYSK